MQTIGTLILDPPQTQTPVKKNILLETYYYWCISTKIRRNMRPYLWKWHLYKLSDPNEQIVTVPVVRLLVKLHPLGIRAAYVGNLV
jgi:hypothetical protein